MKHLIEIFLDNVYLFLAAAQLVLAVTDWSTLGPQGWGLFSAVLVFVQMWLMQQMERRHAAAMQAAEHIIRMQNRALEGRRL